MLDNLSAKMILFACFAKCCQQPRSYSFVVLSISVKIKDLQMLLALLREVEDYANANGDIDPEGDPDAAYAPA